MFDWFCWMAKSPVTGAAPPGFEKFQYGGSSTCELPALGLKMAQVHTYSTSRAGRCQTPVAPDCRRWDAGR